jgi:geranylgeranyl diphosphate synthase type II
MNLVETSVITDFEDALKTYFSSIHFPYGQTVQAAEYALFTGGKRLRPLLLLAALESLDIPYQRGMLPAFSLEMIHTYSLIHDDLPAMDDDDLRRGKPTVHRAFSEGTAILAGDFLLTQAFETLSNAPFNDSIKLALIQSLSKASGALGMIGGQSMDLYFEGKECDISHLHLMHELKTGALIGASLEFAAIIKGLDSTLFRTLGISIGTAFQIKNDIHDPKERNSDVKKKKATYCSKSTDPELHFQQEMDKVYSILQQLNLSSSPLEALLESQLFN